MSNSAAASLGLILCLLFCTLSDRSWSQTRAPKSPEEAQRLFHEQRLKDIERQAEFQRKAEEQRLKGLEQQKAARKMREEYADEAWQEALGVTAGQWQAIKPKLERIRQLRSTPSIDISVYAFGGSGSSHSESSSFSEGSSGGGGSAARGSYSGGSAGGSGGASSGGHYAAGPGGTGAPGVSQAGGGSGTRGASFAGGSAYGGGSGYSFSAGGAAGPVKKQVGDVSLGWQWRRPSLSMDADKLSEGDRACEQLLDALEAKNPDAEQARRRVEALRKIREQRRADLRETQRQLRELVTPEQETRLVLMGYLE